MIDEYIFDCIDTTEKAYWLGFLYADGFIRRRMVRLVLSYKDVDQVERFVEFVGGDKRNIRFYGPYATCGKQAHFYFNSERVVESLGRLGCVNKKAKIIRLPELPTNMYDPFLLGYYDGDGSQHSSEICSSAVEFLADIKHRWELPFSIRKGPTASYLTLGASLFNRLMACYVSSMPRKRKLLNTPELQKLRRGRKPVSTCPGCGEHKQYTAELCTSCRELQGRRGSAYKTAECPKCRGPMYYKSSCCISCYSPPSGSLIRKFDPTVEELSSLINNERKTFVELGRFYGVSDSAVRKRAKKLGIYAGRQSNYGKTRP